MSPAATAAAGGPVRLWRGWTPPVEDVRLYRPDDWVTLFLRQLDSELGKLRLDKVTLECNRPALVVTGAAGPEQLRVRWATYRDLLLFHPSPHPTVDRGVDTAVRTAAAVCAREGSVTADRISRGGRRLLVEQPALLLHPDVVQGLAALGLAGLPPVGVSGLVEVRSSGVTYEMAALRSDRVAVNPGCLGPAIDGGLPRSAHGLDPRVGLRSEIKDELPWSFSDDAFELVGILLPPAGRTQADDRPTHRSGVNIVCRATVEMEPKDVFFNAPDHFESELVLVEVARDGLPQRPPSVLTYRGEQLVELDRLPPLAETLGWALARRGVVSLSSPSTDSPTDPPGAGAAAGTSPPRRPRPPEARGMATNELQAELTLDDAWATDLIVRHSRLNRVLDPEALSEIGEPGKPTFETLGPVFDAIREFELVGRSGRLKASDEARLFEALVYRVGRYLFLNRADIALMAHDLMQPEDREIGENPIGNAYSDRLKQVKLDDEREDPGGVWREQVTGALDELNQEEAVQEYSEVARRGRLMCFCAALWIHEVKRSPEAATVALDEDYRRSLSGDVIALFFRARGLLVSPVLSAAQAQLGLQFVTTALSTYNRNPGMHHTRAIYLLRQSSLTEIESVSLRCLDEALESVETALRSDAEFPLFYATRAKVKYRLRDRPGALIDIRAAIELARYSASSTAVRTEIAGWEGTLDDWQLAPLEGRTGSGVDV